MINKKVAGLGLTLFLLETHTLFGFEAHRQSWQRSFQLAPGSAFLIHNSSGDLIVEPSKTDRVEVTAELIANGFDAAERIQGTHLEVTERDGYLKIQPRFARRKESLFERLFGQHSDTTINYRVAVPDGLRLDFSTTTGDISATNVGGTSKISVINGSVYASKVRGSVSASAINGKIEVEMERVADGSQMSFETVNGRIRTWFPKEVCADVDASSVNGRIKVDFPIQVRGKLSGSSVAGQINRCGGANLSYRSINGGIDILTR